jgi:hypothetical protein
MSKIVLERRLNRRYEVRLPVHYRISNRSGVARVGTGTTYEMSTNGLSFRTRKPLPIGAHVEMLIEWPARYGDIYPVDLQATGFIVRSDGGRTAVRMTSRRFRVVATPAHSISVSA